MKLKIERTGFLARNIQLGRRLLTWSTFYTSSSHISVSSCSVCESDLCALFLSEGDTTSYSPSLSRLTYRSSYNGDGCDGKEKHLKQSQCLVLSLCLSCPFYSYHWNSKSKMPYHNLELSRGVLYKNCFIFVLLLRPSNEIKQNFESNWALMDGATEYWWSRGSKICAPSTSVLSVELLGSL